MPTLRHVSDDEPGITRRRMGRGFRYLRVDGSPVRDAATLKRVRELAIPPAYRDVWICRSANGHLQATGRDARGRKQYLYHPDWVRQRSTDKFAHIIAFAEALPALRRKVRQDLRLPGLPPEKVFALVVSIMGQTLARIGNSSYARSNDSYGLTTLRGRHVQRLPHGGVQLRFVGKSQQQQAYRLDDARLARLVRRCHDLPGMHLFQYLDDDGKPHPVDSGDVNQYLKQAMGGEFSAKDFRTWGATVLALVELAALPLPEGSSQAKRSRLQNQVIDAVARVLGNTPAVCRKSYIDPCAFEAWAQGWLTDAPARRSARQWEKLTLKLLRKGHRQH